MIESFLWGSFAAGSLLIGALISMRFHLPRQVVGVIMAFGVGVLISAIAFELAEEAFHTAGASLSLAIGLASGALTFFGGDLLISNMGGRHRKGGEGQQDSSALAIVLVVCLMVFRSR